MNLPRPESLDKEHKVSAIQTIHFMHYTAARTRLNLVRLYRTQYNKIDKEFANLRRSFDWLAHLSNEEAVQLLNEYVEVLAPYLQQRGLQGELLRWCEIILHLNTSLQWKTSQLLLLSGQTRYALGEWNKAKEDFLAAINASKQDDICTYRQALLALGRLQFNQGDYKIALQTMQKVESLLQETDFEQWAAIRAEVAAYHLNREELDTALAIYLEIDEYDKQHGEHTSTNHMLLMLGVVYRRKKDYLQAYMYLEQLLQRGEVEQNHGRIATAAHHLAWTYLDQGNAQTARKLCGRAITHYEETGDSRGSADAYEQLGCIELTERQGEEAFIHLQRSLIIRRQLHNQQGIASSLRRIAIAHFVMRHIRKGGHYLWQSLIMYYTLGALTRQQLTEILQEILHYW